MKKIASKIAHKWKKFCYNKFLIQMIGLMLAVGGVIIILQVVPTTFWVFLFGVLLILIGCILYKMIW